MRRRNNPLVRLAVAVIVTVLCFAQPKCAAYTTIWTEGFANTDAWTAVNTKFAYDSLNYTGGGGSAYASSTTTAYNMSRPANPSNSRPFYTCQAEGYARTASNFYGTGCTVFFRNMLQVLNASDVNTLLCIGYNSSSNYNQFFTRQVSGEGYQYLGNRGDGACTAAQWILFTITVNDTTVDYFTDNGAETDRSRSAARPSVSRDKGINSVRIGQSASINGVTYWDGVSFSANTPTAPTGMNASVDSTDQITWSATPAGVDYFGFEVFDASNSSLHTSSTTNRTTSFSWSEASLSSNTQYTRYFKAWNGNLSSASSGTASAYTLASAPVLNTNVATTAGGGWYRAATWPGFTNPQGFGTGGKVSKFKYKWSTNGSDSIAENAGTDWSSGTMSTPPASDGVWYLYLRSYNGDNKGNGSTRLGPYNYDNTAPTAAEPESVSASTSGITVNFGDGSDATSGLDATTPYQISRPEGGGWAGSWSADSPLSDPLTGLSGGDEATYTIKTRDKAGNEGSGATIAIRVPPVASGNAVILKTKAAMLASPGLYPNDGQIFASSNGVLYGFNSSTPGQLWVPVNTGGSVQGRMPVATLNSTRTVLAGSQDGKIYARNASTGVEIWTHDLGTGYKATAKPAGALNRTITTPSYTGDVVFAATDKNDDSNFLRAIRADTGATLWTYQPSNLGPIAGSPAVKTSGSGGTVFIACQTANSTGRVAAVNIADGSELWQAVIGSVTSSVGVKGDGSKVYVVTDGGSLYSLDAATGATQSGYPLTVGTQGIYGAPFHVDNQNGLLLSCNADGAVKMVSLSGPSVAWTRSIAAPSASLEYRSKVYVGSSDGKLYELNIGDGTVSASRTIGYTVGDPVVDAVNSLLYVGATDGGIYSFSLPF